METTCNKRKLSCINHKKGGIPLIEYDRIEKSDRRKLHIHEHEIVCVTQGSINISFAEHVNIKVKRGMMVLIPAGSQVSCVAIKTAVLTIFRLRGQLQFCKGLSFEQLQGGEGEVESKNWAAPVINANLRSLIIGLNAALLNDINCPYYHELKMKEFFFLLHWYYPQKQLKEFFRPLASKNTSFSEFIYANYQQAWNSADLARISNYSLSGFEKKFKRIFGVSAGKWLTDQKAKSIYHQITCTDKPFKAISQDFGFSSDTYFYAFCKTQFDQTPGVIRRQNTNK